MSEPAAQDHDPKKRAGAPDAAPQADVAMPKQADASKPSNGYDSSPKGADPNKPANGPAGPTTPLRVLANYENIPGTSKNGPTVGSKHTALWFNPLAIKPFSPQGEPVQNTYGVTKGDGQEVTNHPVPLQAKGEAGAGEGTGELTAQLMYASDFTKSYSVKLSGDFKDKPQRDKAQAALKPILAKLFEETGDLAQIEVTALKQLQQDYNGVENLRVALTINEDKRVLQDAGKTHVYYLARAHPSILLNVPVVAVAEHTITSGATTTKQHGGDIEIQAHQDIKADTVKVDDTKTEEEAHGEGTVQTINDQYHEEDKRMYQEVVTTILTRVDTITQDLIKQDDADSTFRDKGSWTSHEEKFHFDDFTKYVKGGTEEGDRVKKNLAAWIQDAIGGAKSIIDIPFIKNIPKVGKWLRRFNEAGLVVDLAEKLAGAFAVRGTVHFKDTHEDTDAHDKQHDTDDAHGDHDRTVTRTDHRKVTDNLKGAYTSLITGGKTTFGTDTTTKDATRTRVATQTSGGGHKKTSTDDYTHDGTHTEVGGSQHVLANQSTTTELHWSQTDKMITTQPVLQARIVAGKGQVSSEPFPSPALPEK